MLGRMACLGLSIMELALSHIFLDLSLPLYLRVLLSVLMLMYLRFIIAIPNEYIPLARVF